MKHENFWAFLPVVGPVVSESRAVTLALADRHRQPWCHRVLSPCVLGSAPEAGPWRRVLDEVFMGAGHKKFIKVMRRRESLVLRGRAQHQGV